MALIVQKKFLESAATSSLTLNSAVADGNALAILVQWAATTAADLTSVTDGQGRTYTIDAGSKRSGATTNYTKVGVALAYVIGITGSAAPTLTLHFSSAVVRNTLAIYELLAASFDQAVSATGASNAPSAGSLTTTVAGCAGLAVCGMDDGVGAGSGFSGGSGWTLDGQGGGGSDEAAAESREVAVAGSITGDFGNTRSGTWFDLLATFKPPASIFVPRILGYQVA